MQILGKLQGRGSGIGRHITVTGVLFSFAVIVAVATIMVLSAIERVAENANVLDDERSRETTIGALKTFEDQLGATLDDYAAWDDAAANVYAPDGMAWTVSNYGEMSVNSSLFDVAIVIDDTKNSIIAYRDGKPMEESLTDFFAPSLWKLLDTVKAAGSADRPQAVGFVRTKRGIAAAGVALVRQKSGALDVPTGQHRYLIFARHLDDDRVSALGQTYVIGGLRLAPATFKADYLVSIVDPLGATLGKLVWTSRSPGNVAYAQVRPMVIEALGLVGMFFMVLLAIGWLAGRRLKAEENSAREEALRDRLSGLSNRDGLGLAVDGFVAEARQSKRNVLLLYLDLDGFKEVNDSYGHGTGDQLIRAVAAGLQVLIPQGAVLARIGGDEFAIAFLSDGENAAALQLSEQILDFMVEPLEIGRRVVVVGASIGIAMSPAGAIDREELVRRSDLAMYKAKEAGRARMTLYDPSMDADREQRNALELDLRIAIESGDLTLAYQPLVDAATQALTGVEALVRWNRPGHGPVSPEVFIPIAETSGLIESLGLFVLRKACETAKQWPELNVSVNVSPGQFRNPAFTDYVRYVLKQTEIEASRITLEITEGYMIQNPQRTRQSIERLKGLGVKVALDDFGSGFSSIGYLRQFGFDRIKIDRSLVMGVNEDKRQREMLQATVALARSLDIPVTAEGIETEGQAVAMRLFGCDCLQGYLFGKPMVAEQITDMLNELRAAEPSTRRRLGAA
ncbi:MULTISPECIES: putative bifunctional diguanylate cyclase/phosphodiesterase [Rhizobium]|uniref:EAL domain-containing protein n=2 Tax=Rhizobium TaxID=379 RepID=A0A192TF88_9HYPH|nr:MULTISPECIES: EAL domain-containing protein [Rhizobium]ACE92847.1 putative sensory box/GGDEF family protein (nitrogen fixation positive activator protein-like protein) [Rhizobium etli CIAT 652]ANL42169.1 GGDEF/EAL domain-containing protein [Rhizobium phaseoli]ANL54879.1 GGDEF/EAL domain-containing protein [Rhizobium phaseoli]ANL61156.1 GGDEF/EAL domain-containing protein [Rhizobium phaseoli]ANL86521.1 GGDEF/EAL domain-containing protein [Rhizobium phaseoli]